MAANTSNPAVSIPTDSLRDVPASGKVQPASRLTTRQVYRRLFPFLKPHRASLIGAMVALVVFGATDGAIPFLIKRVLDQVFSKADESLLLVLPVAILIFALVRGCADFAQQFLMAKAGHLVTRDIRNALNSRIIEQEPGYFVGQSGADLLTRSTSDVLMIRGLLTDTVSSVLRDSIRVLVLAISCIVLDPTLALIALVVLPIGVLPIVRFGKRLRKLARRGQDEIGLISARMQESISGVRVVQLFSREGFERARFARDNQALTNTFIRSERIRALVGPINELLGALAIGGIVIYGGYSVLDGGRTQGDFIAFLVSVFLMYDPIKKLSRIHATVQQGMAGAERVLEILDRAPMVLDAPADQRVAVPQEFSVELSAVSFHYPDKQELVLDNVSLRIEAGKTLALVGASGSGKSTIVDLIPRFIDPVRGEVRIGGVPIQRLSLVELRRLISVVGQHTFLFNDTVRANILYGLESASDAAIQVALEAAAAAEFVAKLPHGLDTKVGEGGFALSGGERQRLAIARAIIKASPILVLDEATASLDNASERIVQEALDRLAVNRTTIVVAHRLSTIQHADAIAVLERGKVIECGQHAELLHRGGAYAQAWNLQFQQPSGKSATIVRGDHQERSKEEL